MFAVTPPSRLKHYNKGDQVETYRDGVLVIGDESEFCSPKYLICYRNNKPTIISKEVEVKRAINCRYRWFRDEEIE